MSLMLQLSDPGLDACELLNGLSLLIRLSSHCPGNGSVGLCKGLDFHGDPDNSKLTGQVSSLALTAAGAGGGDSVLYMGGAINMKQISVRGQRSFLLVTFKGTQWFADLSMHHNPGRLNLQVKLRVPGPSAGIDYSGLGSLRMYISNKLPGAAARQGPYFAKC